MKYCGGGSSQNDILHYVFNILYLRKYKRGVRVLLQLKCMEMSSSFLGSDIDVTLLEADAVLLGLLSHKK